MGEIVRSDESVLFTIGKEGFPTHFRNGKKFLRTYTVRNRNRFFGAHQVRDGRVDAFLPVVRFFCQQISDCRRRCVLFSGSHIVVRRPDPSHCAGLDCRPHGIQCFQVFNPENVVRRVEEGGILRIGERSRLRKGQTFPKIFPKDLFSEIRFLGQAQCAFSEERNIPAFRAEDKAVHTAQTVEQGDRSMRVSFG